MNPMQRRATALTSDQIAYVRGCQRLQLAVFKLTHKDPLSALSNKFSFSSLKKAIYILMEARQKVRLMNLKNFLKRWQKAAQNITLSSARKTLLLRARISHIDAFKKYVLSQSFKSWRIRSARSVEDFLNRIGAFWKLMEIIAKKKTKNAKSQFMQRLSKTISPEFYKKPLKECVNVYSKFNKLMKSRAFSDWRNNNRNHKYLMTKRQLLLKNIIKPRIAGDKCVLKGLLHKWKRNTIGVKNEQEKLDLLRGHSTYSIYSKWNKANILKAISNAFNEWRRRAMKKPVDYKARILDAKPHMIKHNINMNGEDLLETQKRKYRGQQRRNLLRRIISKINRFQKNVMKKDLKKWANVIPMMAALKDKRDLLLKNRVLRNCLNTNMKLISALNTWRANTRPKDDYYTKNANLMYLLNAIARKLNPLKSKFLFNLKTMKNPNYYIRNMRKVISIYDRTNKGLLSRALKTWHDKAMKLDTNQLKKALFLKTIHSNMDRTRETLLRNALNRWQRASKSITDSYNKLLFKRSNVLFSLYGKWTKFNKGNMLSFAFNTWRRKAAVPPVDYAKLLIEAKPHILRHNILKNAEGLMEALKEKLYLQKRENMLTKALKQSSKVQTFMLRRYLRRWYINALKAGTKAKFFSRLLINNDLRMNHLIEKMMRKALYTWQRNAVQPKTIIPNTEKACDLIRKATTEPFFIKLREKLEQKKREDTFKMVFGALVRNKDKDLERYYVNKWRTNTRKLRAYEFNAIFLNQFLKNRLDKEKTIALQLIKERADLVEREREECDKILFNVISKIDSLKKLSDRKNLRRCLAKWRAACGPVKDPFELAQNYFEGLKSLEKFCQRNTHEDVLYAFDAEMTVPAQLDTLYRVLRKYDLMNVKETLRTYIRKWQDNIKDRGQTKKLQQLFNNFAAYNRKELFAPYKDICDAMKSYSEERKNKTEVITDFLRGLRDLPNQMKIMNRTKLLLKIMDRGNTRLVELMRSNLLEWSRRTAAIKQENYSEIIQKFIRDQLQKRTALKDKIENAFENIKYYIWSQVFQRICDSANKNVLKDILLKYFNNKDANNMKVLKDKFRKWNSLLPYLRQVSAATLIQSWFRGKMVRDELNKERRLKNLLLNIVVRYKNDPAPYLYKWLKNSRLMYAQEMNLVIQNFCRNNLKNRLKNKACQGLQDLFYDHIFKQVADMIKDASRFQPDNYEKFVQILTRALKRQPYETLMKGMRWSNIMNKMTFAPGLFQKLQKTILRKYLERWYENGYAIPNSAALLIQAVFRGFVYRNYYNSKQTLKQKLMYIMNLYSMKKEDMIKSYLYKWNKNTQKLRCNENGELIHDFCRQIRQLTLLKNQQKWKYISHRLLPHQINTLCKFGKINRVVDKVFKRRFMEQLDKYAFMKYINDLFISLLSKYDDNAKMELVRRKLNHWRNQVRRMNDYKYCMARLIQNTWREYHQRNLAKKNMRLKTLLQRFIERILNYSDACLPAALHTWNKNAQMMRIKQSGTTIQDFCLDIKETIKAIKYKNTLKKIGEGLDILDTTPFGLIWAYDKLKQNNKLLGLANLVYFLQDKITSNKKEFFNRYNEWIKGNLVSKLFPFRKYFQEKILRMKLKQWKDIADELKRKDEMEEHRNNKIIELLKIMIDRYDDDKMAVMKRNLKRWKENAQEITKVTNSKKISKYITDVYKTMKARIMWKSLGGKLKFSKFSQETKELINYIKKLVGLQTFINDITDKIKKDGLDKLKTGDYWLRMIEVLNKFFGIQDEKNKLKIIKKYLNRWKNNVERMIIRDNKLDEALDNVNKRLYIDNANASSDIFLVKKVNDLVPYARAKDFFKNLRILSDKWDLLVKQQGDRLGDLFDRLLKNYGSLLKRKLIQWKNTARKITEQTAQKRIADFIKNKFRIMNARDNWQRISKSLSMYAGNKDLYSLLRILRKRMALQSMCKSLDDAFKKPALDQLRDGADYLNLINFLKRLFGDWENRNVIASLHHFMIKWKTKAYKIKARDEKINKALSALDNRILTNSVSTMGNMFLIKKFNDTIPAARAAAFLERTKKRAEMMRVLGEQQVAKIKRYIHRLMRSTEEFLREKLLQWKNTAMKTKEETAKRKIARMIENKYKTNLARAQWKNLTDKYDLFVNNSLIYYVRARLRNWLRLRDMMEKLNNQFKKVGYDQFREAAKLDHTIGFLQGLFNNWEGRNNFLIKRFYMRRWVDKINRLRQRDQKFGTYMKEIDKQFIINSVNTITDASLVRNVTKAVPAARAADFFTNLRRLWGDWDKIRKRILNIMGKYLESEDEKRINYLKRKLLQWKDNAREMTKEVCKNKLAKWFREAYRSTVAKQNWKDLANKYDMFVNKTALFQLKQRLRNWLRLRDMAEKLRNKFTTVGIDQFKEGIEFKKILIMMRTLFDNWDERNKFLAKRFFIRRWFMKVKNMKQRDAALEEAMKTIDKKLLQNSIISLTDILEIKRVCNAVPVARAVDFFTNLRRLWGDWDKVR